MLEILEQRDHTRYPLPVISASEELCIVEAMEEGEVAGHAIFTYTPECVRVYACTADALELFDGIARTVLFKAALKGIHRGEFLCQDDRLQKLKLTDEHGICADIDAILNGCQGCRHAEN